MSEKPQATLTVRFNNVSEHALTTEERTDLLKIVAPDIFDQQRAGHNHGRVNIDGRGYCEWWWD